MQQLAQSHHFENNLIKPSPKIICVGKNYIKHVIEMGGAELPTKPVLFLKPWSSLNYQPTQLRLPASKLHKIDHQLELGVYISKGGSNIAKEEAFNHIGGYFIGIDFTDRDLQNQQKEKRWPWTLSKGQDNFCPVSSLICKQVDPYSIELEMRVNGQTKQRDMTANMHFKIDEIISFVSQYMKLQDGDLLLTGTPEGVGPVNGGDRLQALGRVGESVVASLQFEVIN